MTKDQMIYWWTQDYGSLGFKWFENLENKRASRPDLHAFMLLDSLVPGIGDLVDAAEHDQIWLSVDVEKLAEVITAAQIEELERCGVHYDTGIDKLYLFV